MYPNNFFMPFQQSRMIPNGLNLISKRNGGLLSLFKNLNISGFLNNANKTLNVVNQTIPLVKQAGPMFNNMKSMIRLASAFKDETTQKEKKETNIDNINQNNNYNSSISYNYLSNNQPSFFI